MDWVARWRRLTRDEITQNQTPERRDSWLIENEWLADWSIPVMIKTDYDGAALAEIAVKMIDRLWTGNFWLH